MPTSTFVARFIGTQPASLIPGRGANGHGMLRAEDLTLAEALGPGTFPAR